MNKLSLVLLFLILGVSSAVLSSIFMGTKPAKLEAEMVSPIARVRAMLGQKQIDKAQKILTEIDWNRAAASDLKAGAELYFDMRDIRGAVALYERYLATTPSDDKARTTYASALTLLGDYKLSIAELEAVLSRVPKDFAALANLTITYSEIGDLKSKDMARTIGAKAIEHAPTQEARDTFLSYFNRLVAPLSELEELRGFIVEHPIAGGKFAKLTVVGDEVTAYFKDFPLAAMPEHARNSFVAKMQEKAGSRFKVKIGEM